MNREDLDGLLRPTLGLMLTYPEVDELVRHFDLAPPLSILKRADSVVPDVETTLARAQIVVDGALADWFPALWRTISRPPSLVSLERRIGLEVYQWIYLIDEHTFAEQSQTDTGFGWFFAPHTSLLPRVLLAAGLLRPVDPDLDPFGGVEAWDLAFELYKRGDAAPASTLILQVTEMSAVTASDMVDQVAALLGAPIEAAP